MAANRNQGLERDQEHLVESYLAAHPWSTVVDIRDGIEAESGIRVERVQARLDTIARRRTIRKGPADQGRTVYALGAVLDTKIEVVAGCILRLDTQERRLTARTHREAVSARVIPEEVLAEAQRCAQGAYERVLRTKGYGHLLGVAVAGGDVLGAADEGEDDADPFGIFAALDG